MSREEALKGRGDGFIRKAQTKLPNGTVVERDWTPSERYQLFARGYRDGAGTKPMRADHMGLGPYDNGYAQGQAATRAACAAYAAKVEYRPTILRAAADAEALCPLPDTLEAQRYRYLKKLAHDGGDAARQMFSLEDAIEEAERKIT